MTSTRTDRKADTRRRVVRAAAAAIREHGPEAVGVAAVMKEVGLTHGGFYAHFPSKDALTAAAVEDMLASGRGRFETVTAGLSGAAALEAFIDAYVSARHRDGPRHGCPLALLASDIARQPVAVREAFDAGYRRLVRRIADCLDADARPSPEILARSALAEMAGAVALSRAVVDIAESDALLAVTREAVKARLAAAAPPLAKPPAPEPARS